MDDRSKYSKLTFSLGYELVEKFICKVLEVEAMYLRLDYTLYELGFDSLLLERFINLLQGELGSNYVIPSIVFDNPTVRSLADSVNSTLLEPSDQFKSDTHQVNSSDSAIHTTINDCNFINQQVHLQSTVSEPKHTAVIGCSCNFAGHQDDFYGFRDLLKVAVSSETAIPVARITPDHPTHLVGGFVNDIDCFDNNFFRISPHESMLMDPKQRLLLQSSYQALRNSALTVQKIKKCHMGVFIGAWSNDYSTLHLQIQEDQYNAINVAGQSEAIAAGRLAYFYDTCGPALSMDTACSSSAVAVHTAIKFLRLNDIELAVCASANICIQANIFNAFIRSGLLSASGVCRAFDIDADGYIRSEGVATLVLQKNNLQADPPLALILGSATNQDGQSVGLMAPNRVAQAQVRCMAQKELNIEEVLRVEGHGTGTRLGDRVELLSILDGSNKDSSFPLGIHSVKTLIGHTEACAGLAGILRVAAHFDRMTPHLHFSLLRGNQDQKTSCFVPVVETLCAMKQCGINSFGFSGTNVHLVLQGTDFKRRHVCENPYLMLPITAKTSKAQRLMCEDLILLFNQTDTNYVTICRALQRNCDAFDYRLVALGEKPTHLISDLKEKMIKTDQTKITSHLGQHSITALFTGGWSTYVNMGLELLKTNQTYSETFMRMLNHFQCRTIVYDTLFCSTQLTRHIMLKHAISNPIGLFCLQNALMSMWNEFNIQFQYLLGHSFGEFAAATAAAMVDVSDVYKIIEARELLIQQCFGYMLACNSSINVASKISNYFKEMYIACVNSNKQVVFSGKPQYDDIVGQLKWLGFHIRHIGNVPVHSPLMECVISKFASILEPIQFLPSNVSFISGILGCEISILSGNYWVAHLCKSVQFLNAIKTIATYQTNCFLEIGPEVVLLRIMKLGNMNRFFQEPVIFLLSSMTSSKRDWITVASSLVTLFCHGFSIQWPQTLSTWYRIDTPNYYFEKNRFWIKSTKEKHEKKQTQTKHDLTIEKTAIHPLLGEKRENFNNKNFCFESNIYFQNSNISYLLDNRIEGNCVFPASGYVEIIFAAVKEMSNLSSALSLIEIHDFLVLSPRVLLEEESVCIQTCCEVLEIGFKIEISSKDNNCSKWQLHAQANAVVNVNKVVLGHRTPKFMPCSFQLLDSSDVYNYLSELDIVYGPAFQTIKSIICSEGQSCSNLSNPDDFYIHMLHPCLLDGIFQSFLLTYYSATVETKPYFVFQIKHLEYLFRTAGHADNQISVVCHGVMESASLTGDSVCYKSDGSPFLCINGLVATQQSDIKHFEELHDSMYHYVWTNIKDNIYRTTPDALDLDHSYLMLMGTSIRILSKIISVSLKLVPDIFITGSSSDFSKVCQTEGPFTIQLILNQSATIISLFLEFVHLTQHLAINNIRTQLCIVTCTRTIPFVCHASAFKLQNSAFPGYLRCVMTDTANISVCTISVQETFNEAVFSELGIMLQLDKYSNYLHNGKKWYSLRILETKRSVANKTILYNQISSNKFGSTLISGGFTGIGFETFLIIELKRNDRTVLIGRRTPSQRCWKDIDISRDTRKDILLLTCDLTETTPNLLHHLCCLTDIYHSAGILSDRNFRNLSLATIEIVINIKCYGAILLYLTTCHDICNHLTLFSSIICGLGNHGQSNYAAANSVIESLTYCFTDLGSHSLSIAWGPWAKIGMAVDANDHFNNLGYRALEPYVGTKFLIASKYDLNSSSHIIFASAIWWKIVEKCISAKVILALLTENYSKPAHTKISTNNQKTFNQDKPPSTYTEIEHVVLYCLMEVLSLPKGFVLDSTIGFVQLGMDSLSAVVVSNLLQSTLGPNFSVTSTIVFDYPTVSLLATLLHKSITATNNDIKEDQKVQTLDTKVVPNELNSQTMALDSPSPKLSQNDDKLLSNFMNYNGAIDQDCSIRPIKASPYTYLFWIEYQMNPTRNDYNVVIDQKISGAALDTQKLQAALHRLVNSCIIINSHLIWIDDLLFWQKNQTIYELELFESVDGEKRFVEKPFSLETGPLYRFGIFKVSKDIYNLILIFHHAILDGNSVDELLSIISRCYNSEEVVAQSTDTQIKVINETNNYLSDNLQQIKQTSMAADYWKNLISNFDSETDIAHFKTNDHGVGEYRFRMKKRNLYDLSILLELNASLFSFLSSIFGFMMSRYCNSKKIIIAYPQKITEASTLIFGGQINTIFLPINMKNDSTMASLINESHFMIGEKQGYHYIPTNEIVANSNISKVNIYFVQTNLKDTKLSFNECCAEINERYNIDIAGAELMIEYAQDFEYIMVRMRYNKSLFTEQFIKQIGNEFLRLTEWAANKTNIHQKLSEISILTKHDYHKIVYDWNRTYKCYPKEKTIYQLIDEQVSSTPDTVAAVFEEQQLTYEKLHIKANKLSYHLRSKMNVNRNPLVALCLDRGHDVIIGMLGVMKAGGAYVPIDPEYPPARRNYILHDALTNIVITEQQRHSFEDQITVSMVELDNIYYLKQEKQYHKYPTRNISSDLVYVLYTSGTTGHPKGVVIEHMNLVHSISSLIETFNIRFESHFLQFSSIVFDVSALEIFASLTSKGCLFIITDECRKSTTSFVKFLARNEINVAAIVPAYLSTVEYVELKALNTLIVTGESCPQDVIDTWSKNGGLINAYGPTECTITATTHEYKQGDINTNIGKPLSNTKCYVLDMYDKPTPIGVFGELHIGGAGVARGYLNKPEKTMKAFIQNPFANQSEQNKSSVATLYKTGDLVRWLPTGDIEYIGRTDFQVKVRGHRIELGEVENALCSINNIKQACVLTKEENINKYLVGYFTASLPYDENCILKQLSKLLPNYMIPNVLIQIKIFPLTINGKLDRKALAAIDHTNDRKMEVFSEENDIEKQVCKIVGSILGLETCQVTTTQSFFQQGGNSYLCIELQRKLKQIDQFSSISVADIFKFGSIKKLIENFSSAVKIDYKEQILHYFEHNETAIIGKSGAFTGADNISELWELVTTQREGVVFLNSEQCLTSGVDKSKLEDQLYVPVSGLVKNIEYFDPHFWHMSPNEAKLLDPQIRKFLEHCWSALEASGHTHSYKSFNIGVFAGSGFSTYLYDNILNGDAAEEINLWDALVNNSKDSLATKTAFMLGLTGLANSINTACSTSLVTVVEACKNLHFSFCDIALAGGVSLIMPHRIGYLYQDGMILSKDGHCRTFDIDASGTTIGSGVGVVLLRCITEATNNGDNVIAVIKGYATNNDGDRKHGYVMPSAIGQSECIINAQKMADIPCYNIDYIECHGTGTRLGDSIEIQGLKDAFEYGINKQHSFTCHLGSVKPNIGHTDAAAGVAALIKVCCMLQNKMIPGQANFSKVNPDLHMDETHFNITTENISWIPRHANLRVAGISSFGIGGTNAHVLVTDHGIDKQDDSANCHSVTRYVFQISAKSMQSLKLYVEALGQHLSMGKINDKELASIAYTLQERRNAFSWRCAYSATTVEELIYKLKQTIYANEINSSQNKNIIFMFPGQGSQYAGMAKDLFSNDEYFQELVKSCCSTAMKYSDVDICQVIYSSNIEECTYNINDTKWAQITLFIISYSFAKFLEAFNITANAYIGHSIGEYVAATLSGIFCSDHAIRAVLERGKLMQSMPSGGMIAVKSDLTIMSALAKKFNVEIAAINSENDIVISGTNNSMKLLQEACNEKGIASVKLKTSHAFHSRMMTKAADQFCEMLKSIQLNTPQQYNIISNLTGSWADDGMLNPKYWAEALRHTVHFASGIETLCKHYKNDLCFIEIGPGKSLCSFVKQSHRYRKYSHSISRVQLLPSFNETIKTGFPHIENWQDVTALLWKNNIIAKANSLMELKNRVDLPTYQFDYKSCWICERKKNSTESLKLLSKDQWLSSPLWTPICWFKNNWNKQQKKHLFNTALFFITETQKERFDFKTAAKNQYFIILDESVRNAFYSERNSIKINPITESDYEKALHMLPAKQEFDAFIHLATLDSQIETSDPLNYGFYSLFLIKQLILPNVYPKHFFILTDGLAQISNRDAIRPFNGAMVGAVRNMAHENPSMTKLIIDVSPEFTGNLSILSFFTDSSISLKTDPLLAIKFGKLWQQELQTVSLTSHETLIRDNQTILITGGLGHVGLAIGKYISEKRHINIVLISRGNIYNKADEAELKSKHRIIEEIRHRNCKVDIVCGDISDLNFVSELVKGVEKKYGGIQGIIHAAADTSFKTHQYSLQNLKNAFRGKVYGIHNIICTINCEKLIFIANRSSLASIMGDINRIEYCAANSYLDFLCFDKQKLGNVHVLTVNMPRLINIGCIRNFQIQERKSSRKFDHLIDTNCIDGRVGAELFYNCINQHVCEQFILSKYNIEPLRISMFHIDSETSWTGADTITLMETDYLDIEYKVAHIFCEVLGLRRVSLYDDFFTLGGNSLLAVQLISKLRAIEISYSLQGLVKGSTIKDIAAEVISSKTVNKIVVPLAVNCKNVKNVFFIHAVGGSVIAYKQMVGKLDDRFNYYGIQNINIYNRQLLVADTLEMLAEVYVDEILTLQPNGDYMLAGASMGGTIAYEMAYQLEKRGKKVNFVAMFDSGAQFTDALRNKALFENEMIRQSNEYYKDLTDIDETVRKHLLEARWDLMRLLIKYKPVQSAQPIELYKANILNEMHTDHEIIMDYGWPKYTSGNINVYNIDGDHNTILMGKALSQVCDKFNQSLESIMTHQ